MKYEPRELDVRPILATGGQPMDVILQTLESLEAGQALRLIAPFRPEPLFRIFDRKGYDAHPVDRDNGDCEVLFVPRGGERNDGQETILSPLAWPDPERHLDLTDIPAADCSASILEELGAMQEGKVLFVLLGREPQDLYSDLTSRGHRWVGNFDGTGACYRILILKGHGPA